MNKNNLLKKFFILIVFFLSANAFYAQQKDYLAVVPTFYDRVYNPTTEYPIQLQKQRFVLFVYKNAAAVYTEAEFLNTGSTEMQQELSLPSTGFYKNGDLQGVKISNGILSVHLWTENERVKPKIVNDGNEEWFTIQTRFQPGESHIINALFWVQTSLNDIDSLPGLDSSIIKDGQRGFMINLSQASIWKDYIASLDVVVVLKDSIIQDIDSFDLEPKTYDLNDSTLTWSYNNIEPNSDDNIFFYYSTVGQENGSLNTMIKISEFMVKYAYKDLVSYYNELYQD